MTQEFNPFPEGALYPYMAGYDYDPSTDGEADYLSNGAYVIASGFGGLNLAQAVFSENSEDRPVFVVDDAGNEFKFNGDAAQSQRELVNGTNGYTIYEDDGDGVFEKDADELVRVTNWDIIPGLGFRQYNGVDPKDVDGIFGDFTRASGVAMPMENGPKYFMVFNELTDDKLMNIQPEWVDGGWLQVFIDMNADNPDVTMQEMLDAANAYARDVDKYVNPWDVIKVSDFKL